MVSNTYIFAGLFHKAIMQSGNAFSAWAVNSRKNGRLLTTAFAVATSCYRRKIKSMVICLQELPAIELVNAENRLTVGTHVERFTYIISGLKV